jgi:hypothetical protein
MQAVPDPPEIARRARTVLRLTENAHLPFDKLMALSKAEGPFGRPFDRLTVLSKVEGLTALSKVDPSTSLRVDAEQRRSIEGLRYPHPPPC